MSNSKLLVVSGTNFLRSYGGIKYLSNSLVERGIDVRAYAPIPAEMLTETWGCRFPLYSYYASWYGRFPRIRGLIFRTHLLLRGLSDDAALLFSELTYFREAVAIKKARPRTPLLHYCQELLTPEEYPEARGVEFYERNADVPDLVLDVEPHRAAKRKDRYGLTSEVLVLPNTIPHSEIPAPAPAGTLSRRAGGALPTDVPTLVYTGGLHPGVPFDVILDALAMLSRPVFFLGFCHGSPDRLENLRRRVHAQLGPERARICAAVPRLTLLSSLHEATAGLVYYPYSAEQSTNQLYCAPTKVFEYIATGLPVIASANPPLIDLIEGRMLGMCAKDDSAEALADVIDSLMQNPYMLADIRERAPRIFADELCFEWASGPALAKIVELLNQRTPAMLGR